MEGDRVGGRGERQEIIVSQSHREGLEKPSVVSRVSCFWGGS